MDELTNCRFQLISNDNGHVRGNTVMEFNHSSEPNIASYSGPNVVYGQVMVAKGVMLYQALDTAGQLSAGKAAVTYIPASGTREAQMILNWQWLTGDKSAGISTWKKIP